MKVYSLLTTSFAIYVVKAAEKKTGNINIKVDGKDIVDGLVNIAKVNNERNILVNLDKKISSYYPLYHPDNYYISEFKIGGTPKDVAKDTDIVIGESENADITLEKKLILKEIKFNDSNFKLCIKANMYNSIRAAVSKCKSKNVADIFAAIKNIPGLFKTGEYGIKIGNFEDKNEAAYNGTDKLTDIEITVILDDKKLNENAISKLIIDCEDPISDQLKNNLLNIDFTKGVKESFGYLNCTDCSKVANASYKVYIDGDESKSFDSNSDGPFPGCSKFYKIKIPKGSLTKEGIHATCKVQMTKKGCKLVNENVLKNIQERMYIGNGFFSVAEIINILKENYYIVDSIDKNMISIKSQDSVDNKEYRDEKGNIELTSIVLDLDPKAFREFNVKLVFSLKEVEKEGKVLKDDFKNKFDEKNFHLGYGDKKTVLLNILQGIIPGITEADIKLNDKALTENITEGGEISIPVEKIPDTNFVDKPKLKTPGKTEGTTNGQGSVDSTEGQDGGNGDTQVKEKGNGCPCYGGN